MTGINTLPVVIGHLPRTVAKCTVIFNYLQGHLALTPGHPQSLICSLYWVVAVEYAENVNHWSFFIYSSVTPIWFQGKLLLGNHFWTGCWHKGLSHILGQCLHLHKRYSLLVHCMQWLQAMVNLGQDTNRNDLVLHVIFMLSLITGS